MTGPSCEGRGTPQAHCPRLPRGRSASSGKSQGTASSWSPARGSGERDLAGKIVTVHIEDTHFRITRDGTELAIHPRNEQRPVTRWKAYTHAPKPDSASSIS